MAGDSHPFCWVVEAAFSQTEDTKKWLRFSTADATRLEQASLQLAQERHSLAYTEAPASAVVQVYSGRYDVDVGQRLMRPAYWDEPERRVLRTFWFYDEESGLAPYEEYDSAKLEAAFESLCSGKSRAPLEVPLRACHPGVVHFSMLPDGVTSYLMTDLGPGPAGAQRFSAIHYHSASSTFGRTVKRGYVLPAPEEEDEQDLSDGHVACLVLVCHGIGTMHCVIRMNCDDMRQIAERYLQRLRNEGGFVRGRIEFLPLEWSATVHGRVDPALQLVTLGSVKSLRHFVNFAVADAIVYETLGWREEIHSELRRKMAQIHALFSTRTPSYDGEVAVVGHSLGSVIMFDILQNVFAEESFETASLEKKRRMRASLHGYTPAAHGTVHGGKRPTSLSSSSMPVYPRNRCGYSPPPPWTQRGTACLPPRPHGNDQDEAELRGDAPTAQGTQEPQQSPHAGEKPSSPIPQQVRRGGLRKSAATTQLPIGGAMERLRGSSPEGEAPERDEAGDSASPHRRGAAWVDASGEGAAGSVAVDHQATEASTPGRLDPCSSRLPCSVSPSLGSPASPRTDERLQFMPMPVCFFALGSPLAFFLNIRLSTRRRNLGRYLQCFGARGQSTRGWRFFNIYHPNDPVAYRLEPLLNDRYSEVPSRLLGKQSLFKGLLTSMPAVPEREVISSEVLKEMLIVEPSFLDQVPDMAACPRDVGRESGDGDAKAPGNAKPSKSVLLDRIDYIMPETMFESLSELLTAIQSHASYWRSEEVVHFLADQILEATAKRRRERRSASPGSPDWQRAHQRAAANQT